MGDTVAVPLRPHEHEQLRGILDTLDERATDASIDHLDEAVSDAKSGLDEDSLRLPLSTWQTLLAELHRAYHAHGRARVEHLQYKLRDRIDERAVSTP